MGIFGCTADAQETSLDAVDDIYKSAFTYNTEREFANDYQSIDVALNGYSDVDNTATVQRASAESSSISTRIVEYILVGLSAVFLVLTFPITLFFCIKVVPIYERLVVFRVGKTHRVHGAGTVLTLPFVDKAARIDMRPSTLDVPTLELITSDQGIIEIRAALVMRVVDALRVVCSIQERNQVALDIARTTLHNQLVHYTIADIGNERTRERILGKICDALNAFFRPRGVEVGDVKIVSMQVIKQAENQTMNVFSQLLSSDVGKQLMGALGGTQALELLKAAQSQNPPKTADGGGIDWARFAAAATASASPASATSAATTPTAATSSSPSAPSNVEIDNLISLLGRCCDTNLVVKIGRTYRILCEHSNHVYTIDLDLKNDNGLVRLGGGGIESATVGAANANVTFALGYETLASIIRGETSPLSAYINNSVKLVGSIEDALALSHLAARAKELNLTL